MCLSGWRMEPHDGGFTTTVFPSRLLRHCKLPNSGLCRRRLQSPIALRFGPNRRLESPPTVLEIRQVILVGVLSLRRVPSKLAEAGPELDSTTPCGQGDLGKSPNPRAAKSGAVDAREAPLDPDLAVVIDAWPTLPEKVKAKVLAMVKETLLERQ